MQDLTAALDEAPLEASLEALHVALKEALDEAPLEASLEALHVALKEALDELARLKGQLDRYKRLYHQATGRLELLRRRKESIEQQLDQISADLDLWSKAQQLLVDASDLVRERVRGVVEQTVTAALHAVLSDELAFRVEIGSRGGQPTADWVVVSKYGTEVVAAEPEEARGGGVVDVVSLALRMALLELTRPPIEGPLILDEPGKMVSEEYVPSLAAFLRHYAERTGRQVLMVTHNEALAEVAHRSYRVEMVDGTSIVEEL